MPNYAAIITDQHFGVRGDDAGFHTSNKNFYEQVFFPALARMKVSRIINVGDLFDKRASINIETLSLCYDYYFDKVADLGIPQDIIVGNHDCFYTTTNAINSPDLLLKRYGEKFKVYSEAQEVDDFLFIPWINKNNAQHTLGLIKGSNKLEVFGHLELAGFKMYKHGASHKGADAKVFARFDNVYTGHFHHPSQVGNVRYLGAAGQHTWADYDDWRGFHIYDLDSKKIVESIANPYEMFRKITVTPENVDDLENEVNFGPRNYILNISGIEDAKQIQKIASSLSKNGAISVQINDRMLVSDQVIDITEATDTNSLIEESIAAKTSDPLQRERVFELIDNWHTTAAGLV